MLSMTVGRLAVFYKQRDLYFYPAWAYAIPTTILKVPLSMLVTLVWTSLTYYVIEYSPEAGRKMNLNRLVDCSLYSNLVETLTANTTIGQETLESPPGSRAIISNEKLSQIQGSEDSSGAANAEVKSTDSPNTTTKSHKGQVVLPFEPLTLVFQDVQYNVDTPDSAFRPGVLTALMGVSGAGKTTLMNVLAGRKTSGTIEGDIRIGGFPKVQETFARISGYCEQTDIHSPQITVEESVEFVKEVLEIIELDEIKDCLVGMPGVSGLSTEQRKRLTISVELVANPSIIFMDEPTTGLDAKAAAIVMQAMKNVAETGRTIVCTIHQPSIDIFEAFDEDISGVPKIKKNNYNPATWMLDVTSTSAEAELGVVSPKFIRTLSCIRNNKELANRWSTPPPDSKGLYFATRLSQNENSSNAASGSNTRLTGEVQHIQHAAFRVHDCNIFAFLGTVLESRKEIVSKSN
ncbi:unnamed protein product [Camellia sinensis]